ncbi:hypothetical protein [Streptomyces sp. LN699]|uniref:hypothetical protein n=1 Tax=Streptomyces sp. LN699 TaxID=3112981 RepID=UPI0037122354
MTTSADHLIDDALHRSDVEWLSDHLDARSCPPAVLGRLVRHADPRLRHLGLLLLSGRVTSTPSVADERETAELASLLPHFVVDPPEAALLQANLHAHLGPHLRGRPRPSWRTAGLPVRVRIAWLRAELLDDPTVLRHEVRGELLYQAVRETSSTAAHRPERLVAELVGSGDRVLRAEALRLAREGLHAGLLTPARVREHVLALLDTGVWDTGVRGVGVHGSGTTDPGASDPGSVDPTSPHPTSPDPPSSDGSCTAVVVAALRELGEPWAMLDPLPEGRLSVFLTSDPEATPVEVAEAALTAAARHGHRDVVWRVAGDPGGSPALRRRALELLGDLADRGDIRELTALAARDPLLLGAPAVACLRGLHRRGHFPADEDVPAIVGLALADHAITPDEVATILFTCRQATLRVLIDADDDPSRSRRLALLVALAGQGARELPVGEEITRVFATAGAPEPFLAAIRELRYTPAEDVVIALLPTAPAAALDALEAIGGHRTVRALREGLGLPADEDAAQDGGGTGVIAPHLRAVRDRALELLWQLTDARGPAARAPRPPRPHRSAGAHRGRSGRPRRGGAGPPRIPSGPGRTVDGAVPARRPRRGGHPAHPRGPAAARRGRVGGVPGAGGRCHTVRGRDAERRTDRSPGSRARADRPGLPPVRAAPDPALVPARRRERAGSGQGAARGSGGGAVGPARAVGR